MMSTRRRRTFPLPLHTTSPKTTYCCFSCRAEHPRYLSSLPRSCAERQAGDYAGAVAVGCPNRRNELPAQAPVCHQGWASGRRGTARVATLAISDVPGDDPAVIGSGPTVGDPTSCADALKIADKRSIDLPAYARKALAENSWETIKPGDPVLTDATFDLIARPADAQKAAADAARTAGIEPIMLGPISRARLAISTQTCAARNHLPGSSFPVEKRPLRFQANMGAAAAIANIS